MEKLRILGARAGQLLPHLLPEIGRLNAQGQRIILLVPEQYTLQAERELVQGLDLPGMLDLEVLSPRRLNTRITESGGRSPLQPLDDRGRSMALSHSLRACQEQLIYYRRVAEQPNLPGRIAVLLTDMEKAGMDPDSLAAYAQTVSGAARAKLTDLALIWRTYRQLIAGRFADELAQQQDVTSRLAVSGVLTGVHLYVYGFDVLQAPMIDLLCTAMPLAAAITVALVMDRPEANDARIFHTQCSTAHHLIDALEQHGLPWSLTYLTPRPHANRAPALRHLEQHLFTRQGVVYEPDASKVIQVHAAANPFAEASYVAQTLRHWHESGIPWRRMAVALCDGVTLPGIVDVTLLAADIPHYVARKDSAVRHGLCRMLIGALRTAVGGYGITDVLACAKSGFTTLTDEEAMQLENYALENGIDRGKWQRSFTRGEQAEAMNALRERLINPIARLQNSLRFARSAAQSVEAVFQLLVDMGAYDRLMQREEQLLARGMQAEAAQNRQVWQTVMGLLDQLYALLGEARANMKDIAGYMEAGLIGAAISALPPAPDSVMVGEAGHLMTGELDALLLMGVQDGVTATGMDSLISEQERAALTDHNRRPVGMTRQEQNALRQSDFYRTLSLPCQRLTLTFSEGGQDGAALRPAGMIADVLAMFPTVQMTGGVTATGAQDAPLSPLTALDGLALRLRSMADGELQALDADWQEALRWLWHAPAWHDRTRVMLESLNARVQAGALTRTQRSLFTQDEVTISRLERFAECPYRHFVDYGLKPVERRAFVFDANEKGVFFHAAMQEYATLASTMPDWPNVDDEAIDRMVEQVVAPLTEGWADGPLRDDAMGRSLGEAYIRSVRRSAWMFTQHARNSRFTTIGAEVRFGEKDGLPPVILELADGRRIALRGVIDRIDRYAGDHGLYLRVIDYKSSTHSLEPVRMWYGLQLQLLLYLMAAEQSQPGATPAGAFYFRINDPHVTTDHDIQQEAEARIAEAMRLKGVVLADAEVIDAMDADQPGYSLGKVFNKDGSVAASANAYDLNGMRGLLTHARKTAAELADRMHQGCIDVSPAQIDQWSACDWCPYAGICGIDPALPGGEKRALSCADKKELLQRMANEYTTEAPDDHTAPKA